MILQADFIDRVENEGGDIAKTVAKKWHETLRVLTHM